MKFIILLILGYYILRRYINVPLPSGKKPNSNQDRGKDDSGYVDYEEIK